MKKIMFLAILLVVARGLSQAQTFSVQPLINLLYVEDDYGNNRIFVRDSTAYAIRGQGLEIYNASTHSTEYHFLGYNSLRRIIPDTGNTYLYLKYPAFIGRYNYNTQQYTNIWPNITNTEVTDIGVSPDGKVWLTSGGAPPRLFTYNGAQWQQFNLPQTGSPFYKLKVVNDTLAYVIQNQKLYAFHNGIFDSLFTLSSTNQFMDMDADGNGNLWVAANDTLIHYFNGVKTMYDAANTLSGSDLFYHVRLGTNGHVWVAGNSGKLYEFNNSAWQVYSMPTYYSVKDFTLDKNNNPWVCSAFFIGIKALLMYNQLTASWTVQQIPFLPIKNPKAIGMDCNFGNAYANFATDEGWFQVGIDNNFVFSWYSDTAQVPFANDITCFAGAVGTHHGVQNLNGFNNAMLPSLHVNCMIADNGSYYIGTDSGLVVYNGLFYNTMNTNNSPLPSDKITFIDIFSQEMYCSFSSPMLTVGTDKGLALFQNGQWKTYDNTNIPVTNFHVTGVIPACMDSILYVSTQGGGLVEIYPSGAYQVLNTTNGLLLDDTLYYMKVVLLGECGNRLLIGTAHHGIIEAWAFWQPNFSYDTNFNGNIFFHNSKMISDQSCGMGYSIFLTDGNIQVLSACSAVPGLKSELPNLVCFQHGTQLQVDIPENNKDQGIINLYDLMGRTIASMPFTKSDTRVEINIAQYPSGIYLVALRTNSKVISKKVLLNQY